MAIPPLPLILLLLSIGLGTTVTFSTTNWFLAWIGLEINSLAILPLLAFSGHPRAVEAATKYFFTQATGAIMILYTGLSNARLTGEWDILCMTNPTISTMLCVALALKLGLAPLHTWLPEVLSGTSLAVGLLISTWQKLAPFALLYQLLHAPNLVLQTLAVLSIVTGALGGLNQLDVRKLLAYSSISHLGWIILVLQLHPEIALVTMALYFIMTTSAFLCVENLKIPQYAAVIQAFAVSNLFVMAIPFALLSLAGMPPLTGFITKLLIANTLISVGDNFIILAALVGGLLNMPIYIRLVHAAALLIPLLLSPYITRWRNASVEKRWVMASTTIAAMMLLPFIKPLIALFTS